MKLVNGSRLVVHFVDLDFQPRDLARHDPQCSVDLSGRRNVRAEIEQIILDLEQLVGCVSAA
jgi:hypothetical protein